MKRMLTVGNLFEKAPEGSAGEESMTLAHFPGARIERIVSTGQSSEAGFWYDQKQAEWVVLLSGSAALLFEGETAPRILRPGDYIEIPPHARHRVEWTDANEPTVWLAVHVEDTANLNAAPVREQPRPGFAGASNLIGSACRP